MIGDLSERWLLGEIDAAGGADDLAETVVVALGSDRRALPDDVLPDVSSSDRKGVWADTDAEKIWNGWPVGIRLWLLRRAKIVGQRAKGGATIGRIDEYLSEGLQPLVDIGVASRFAIKTARKGLHAITSDVTIFRGPNDEVVLKYQYLWEGITP